MPTGPPGPRAPGAMRKVMVAPDVMMASDQPPIRPADRAGVTKYGRRDES